MLILALCFPREAKGSSDKKGKELFNVLVIQSYNQSLSAYSKFDKLLHEELEKEQIYSSTHSTWTANAIMPQTKKPGCTPFSTL